MKKCEFCQKDINSNASFCSHCGKKQLQNEAPKYQKFQQPDLQKNIKQANPVKKSRWITGISLIGVAAILVAGGFYFFQSQKSPASTQQKVQEKAIAKKQVVFPYRDGELFGLMDSDFNVIKKGFATNISLFNTQGTAFFSDYSSEDYDEYHSGLINQKGKVVTDESDLQMLGIFGSQGQGSSPSKLVLMQSKNGVMTYGTQDDDTVLFGLISSKGERITEPIYPSIGAFNQLKIASVQDSSDRVGVIDEEGNIVIEPSYYSTIPISDKYILVKDSEDSRMFDVIDTKGNIIKENFCKNYPTVSNNKIIFEQANGKYSLADLNLNVIAEDVSSSPIQFSNDGKYYTYQDRKKYGLRDVKTNDVVIEATYEYLSPPNEQGNMAAGDPNAADIIDLDENIVISSQNAISSVGGSNLFTEFDGDNWTTLDPDGKRIDDGEYYLGVASPVIYNDYVIASKKSNIDKQDEADHRFVVLNKDGLKLSDDAVSVSDLGDRLFIQESSAYKIIIKDTGKVVKEKTSITD
ncbi:WG repeat-containing protein [uncultured Enterococcus sp.]|uniref:WG repeat-containing protein n=1 Tax=uncultured Enterococcus sp. TaxID=167972 RepID=UPI0025E6A0AE|nr:WG repeat-containing protein [uncultured Enterococcus sp.]